MPIRVTLPIRRRRHALRVASVLDVVVVEADGLRPWRAYAIMSRRVVLVPLIGSQTSYALALHEIGHCAIGHRKRREGMRDYETRVWAWARQHARPAWTPQMERVARWCLSTYK